LASINTCCCPTTHADAAPSVTTATIIQNIARDNPEALQVPNGQLMPKSSTVAKSRSDERAADNAEAGNQPSARATALQLRLMEAEAALPTASGRPAASTSQGAKTSSKKQQGSKEDKLVGFVQESGHRMSPDGCHLTYYMYLMCQQQRLIAERRLSSARHLTSCLYIDSTGQLVSDKAVFSFVLCALLYPPSVPLHITMLSC
jgi:hypothetical protein